MILMAQDKKAENKKLTLILARGIGQAFISRDVNPNDVRSVWKNLLATSEGLRQFGNRVTEEIPSINNWSMNQVASNPPERPSPPKQHQPGLWSIDLLLVLIVGLPLALGTAILLMPGPLQKMS